MSSSLLLDPATTHTTDPRFQALFQLAQEGVEEAVSDLWHEYGVYWSRPADTYFQPMDNFVSPVPEVPNRPCRPAELTYITRDRESQKQRAS